MAESALHDSLQRWADALCNSKWTELTLMPAMERQYQLHNWFTPEFCMLSLDRITDFLLEAVHVKSSTKTETQTVAILPNFRTPLSGFRDILYVLLSGHNALVRTESHITLFPTLATALMALTPSMSGRVAFCDKLSGFDAVIADLPEKEEGALATHLARFPHVFRKAVCHAAILTGVETEKELRALAHDIYLYFGRTPRSIRKLYVPEDYDFAPLIHILHEESQSIAGHNQFLNHLDYQKSIRLMNKQFYMDSGTFRFVESAECNPPTAVVYFEHYRDGEEPAVGVHRKECISSHLTGIPFGQANTPSLFDYDNNIDIMQFLGQL